jgi:hypothetical protein
MARPKRSKIYREIMSRSKTGAGAMLKHLRKGKQHKGRRKTSSY